MLCKFHVLPGNSRLNSTKRTTHNETVSVNGMAFVIGTVEAAVVSTDVAAAAASVVSHRSTFIF